jgi:hypothetical protein
MRVSMTAESEIGRARTRRAEEVVRYCFGQGEYCFIDLYLEIADYRFGVVGVPSDDNSTEVCTNPSACDSRPIPICSLTVVHAK